MKRILVVNDVGLWLSLNRYFAGGSKVHVSEVDCLETGLRLAQIERPDLIVCGSESIERDVPWLEESLSELPDKTRALCVIKGAAAGVPEPARFATCRPAHFLDTVGRWTESERRGTQGASVDLLAHFEMADDGARRGFANLVALGRAEVLMESDEALEVGDQLSLTFFVEAEDDPISKRQQVTLRCEIRRCHDAEKLLYVADALPIDVASESALNRTIEAARCASETRS